MSRCLVICCATLLASGAARAADVPNLPADTEVVVSVNLEQLLASPLGKKYLRTTVEESIKANAAVHEALKSLGLDPVRDLTRVTIALTSIGSDKGFVIVNGKFDRAKVAESAEHAAAEQKDRLKIHKTAAGTVYEFAGDHPTFATVIDDATILLATDRELLSKKAEPKKELTELIQKIDTKQTAWLAALAGITAVAPAADADQRKTLEKVTSIIGVLKVDTSARLDLTLNCQDPATAAAVNKLITDLISVAKAQGPEAIKGNAALAPLFEIIGGLAVATTGNAVVVTAEVSAAQIEKAVKTLGSDK
jgi:hypothetical protein